jgi:hypothetical protein
MRITLTAALEILLRAWPLDEAALQLTKAMRYNARFPLWGNGKAVPPNIKLTLAVEVRAKPEDEGGGWTATIVSAIREPWEHPPDCYQWEFDESEVVALLPPSADDGPRRLGSREQRMIRRMADHTWPNGAWKDISTREIMKIIGDKLKEKGAPVPGRSTFERALGRRKG